MRDDIRKAAIHKLRDFPYQTGMDVLCEATLERHPWPVYLGYPKLHVMDKAGVGYKHAPRLEVVDGERAVEYLESI